MSEVLEQVGLTGGLLAALIFVGAMFLGERKKRRAAEVRGKASRKNAASAVEVKEEVIKANEQKDSEIAEANEWEEAEKVEIEKAADEVDEAAASGGSSLANIWNKIMKRKKGED